MKCLLCGNWNLKGVICASCLPSFCLGVRWVDALKVYSFYAFSEVELLMHYKYIPIGSRVFSLLSKKAADYFVQNINLCHLANEGGIQGSLDGVIGIGIDDCIQRGYSHTGVMLRSFGKIFIPIYGALLAKNPVSYAGKSLDFRASHPKNFQTKLKGKKVVLFDDVITTGITLKEAKQCLQAQGNEVLFALTLCDASR